MENFKDLGIRQDLVKGLNEMGIVKPTPIQIDVISKLLNNTTDLVGQAHTGTGKTAAFGLPILHQIDPKKKKVQALILSPTRELGQQISKQLFKFTKYSDKIFTEAVFGGQKIEIQIEKLSRPTHILVATPGRLIDLVKRKVVDLYHVKTIVLDEADEMLSMGFKKELDEILRMLSNVENKWLFSATLPHEIKHIINTHLSADSVKIELSKRNVVNKNIQHEYIICDDQEKLNILMRFLGSQEEKRGLIFCKTKASVQKLVKQLQARNIAVDGIHGDLLQKERDKAMRAFKNKTLRILVATDLAARGIDVPSLAFVVHYQMPNKIEYYTHRSGRTARAGKEGLSISLVNTQELNQLRTIADKLKITINQKK